MGYRKRTVQAGGSIEIRKSYCPWDGERRKKKEREPGGTPEAVKRENERRARETLRWLIAANFGVGDFHLTLTFRQQERPAEEEGLKKVIQKFLRKLRKMYNENGKELKYIWTAGIGERGGVHVHMICNAEIPLAGIQAAWNSGMVRAVTLDDKGQYEGLANYLIENFKETREDGMELFKRWACSRNLAKPTIKTEDVRATTWREAIKPPKGYYLDRDSVRRGVDAFGYPWMEYRFLKIRQEKKSGTKGGSENRRAQQLGGYNDRADIRTAAAGVTQAKGLDAARVGAKDRRRFRHS